MNAEGVGMRTGRMLPALRAFASGGAQSWKDLQAQFNWDRKTAQKTQDNALNRKLVERTGGEVDGVMQLRITPLGMQYLGNLDPVADPLPRIAQQALDLIEPSVLGLDSGTLGELLGVPAFQVERALAPHVEAMRLVHCAVTKLTGRFLLYRMSAGGASSLAIWRAQQSTQCRPAMVMKAAVVAAPAPAPVEAGAESEAEIPPEWEMQAEEPAPAPAAAAAEEPLAVAPAEAEKTFLEALLELDLPPAPPAPPAPPTPAPPEAAPKGVPYYGELDIDEVDRKAAAAAGREDPATAFNCALWSTGALVVHSHGTRLTLPVEHTRKLLHYLQHMHADELVASRTGAGA